MRFTTKDHLRPPFIRNWSVLYPRNIAAHQVDIDYRSACSNSLKLVSRNLQRDHRKQLRRNRCTQNNIALKFLLISRFYLSVKLQWFPSTSLPSLFFCTWKFFNVLDMIAQEKFANGSKWWEFWNVWHKVRKLTNIRKNGKEFYQTRGKYL